MLHFFERMVVYAITCTFIVAAMFGVIALGDAGQHGFALICLVIGCILAYGLVCCVNADVKGD